MGSLRLVVVRSRSEDERLDLVHWANSSDQTGKEMNLFDIDIEKQEVGKSFNLTMF